MTTVGIHAIEERYEPEGEDRLSDEEGDLPKQGSSETHHCRAASTRPNGVWFGPKGSEATERELISFLGSHNGVAVLQWPRDVGRSHRLRCLGIPRLWFVHDGAALPVARDTSEEWLPHTASDLEIHESLRGLCEWGDRTFDRTTGARGGRLAPLGRPRHSTHASRILSGCATCRPLWSGRR